MNPLWMSRGLYWLAWANLIEAAVLIAAVWVFGPQWPSALLALLEGRHG